jgi:hypothetical protein
MVESLPSSAATPPLQPLKFKITRLTTAQSVLDLQNSLSILFQDCVTDGFSIGFLSSFNLEEVDIYWKELSQMIPKGNLHLFILTSASASFGSSLILGSIQLHTVSKNGHLHRGEVVKVLVHLMHAVKA